MCIFLLLFFCLSPNLCLSLSSSFSLFSTDSCLELIFLLSIPSVRICALSLISCLFLSRTAQIQAGACSCLSLFVLIIDFFFFFLLYCVGAVMLLCQRYEVSVLRSALCGSSSRRWRGASAHGRRVRGRRSRGHGGGGGGGRRSWRDFPEAFGLSPRQVDMINIHESWSFMPLLPHTRCRLIKS